MTAREQQRFDKLATAVRRILAYQTSRQVLRSAERQYGLEPIEALEYAYDNLRGEAEAVRSLVRAPRPKAHSPRPVGSE
jgi:hypothetical protein